MRDVSDQPNRGLTDPFEGLRRQLHKDAANSLCAPLAPLEPLQTYRTHEPCFPTTVLKPRQTLSLSPTGDHHHWDYVDSHGSSSSSYLRNRDG